MNEPPESNGRRPIETLGGLARVTAGMWARTAAWGVGTSIRMARAAVDPRAASGLLHDVGDELRDLLGVSDRGLDERIRRLLPPAEADRAGRPLPEETSLKQRGSELLRRSADVQVEDGAHPAYARMLEELHPDEARILRLLALEGPQPAVDVRSLQLIGLGSHVVAEGLNMIGQQAGCRRPDRVHAYLNNLNRLGLIWFSKAAIDEAGAYQVLEAQPQVLDALREAPRAKTVQRSIRLTPFGRDFVDLCLPLGNDGRPAADQPVPAASDELGS